jgi:hypothetical protein
MAATVEVLRTLQKEAAGLCPECLHEHVADNAAVLGDLIEVAGNMAAIRQTSPDNEELYQRAFAELMSAVLITAVFTAELRKRPVPFAVAASAN